MHFEHIGLGSEPHTDWERAGREGGGRRGAGRRGRRGGERGRLECSGGVPVAFKKVAGWSAGGGGSGALPREGGRAGGALNRAGSAGVAALTKTFSTNSIERSSSP